MVKLDATYLRYLQDEHFSVLRAVERGMRTFEVVPTEMIRHLARTGGSSISTLLSTLARDGLILHDASQHDGYSLSYAGLDYLALHTFSQRGTVKGLGSRMGCGKESDLYLAEGPDGERLVVKLQRLGRTSFKSVARNRDYRGDRGPRLGESFQVLSCRAAAKEYSFLTALHGAGFPTPRPVDHDRHAIAMECLSAHTLSGITAMGNPAAVYAQCLDILARLAESGLVHGDFNEFNIMVDQDEKVYVLDFPQMVPADAAEAAELFDRDVATVHAYFTRRYKLPPIPFNPTLPKAATKLASGAVGIVAEAPRGPKGRRAKGTAVGKGATGATLAGDDVDDVDGAQSAAPTARTVGGTKAAAAAALRAAMLDLQLTERLQTALRGYAKGNAAVADALTKHGLLDGSGHTRSRAPRAPDAEGDSDEYGSDDGGLPAPQPFIEELAGWAHPRGRASRIVREQLQQGKQWCGGERLAAPPPVGALAKQAADDSDDSGDSDPEATEAAAAAAAAIKAKTTATTTAAAAPAPAPAAAAWPPRGAGVAKARLEVPAAACPPDCTEGTTVCVTTTTCAPVSLVCDTLPCGDVVVAVADSAACSDGVDPTGGVVVVDGVAVKVGWCGAAAAGVDDESDDDGEGEEEEEEEEESDDDSDVAPPPPKVSRVVATFRNEPAPTPAPADSDGSDEEAEEEEGTSTVATRKGSKRSRMQQRALNALAAGTVTASSHQQRRNHPFPQTVASSRATARRVGGGGILGALAAASLAGPKDNAKGLAARTKSAIDLDDARDMFAVAAADPLTQRKVAERLTKEQAVADLRKATAGGLRNVQGDRRQRRMKGETRQLVDSREWADE